MKLPNRMNRTIAAALLFSTCLLAIAPAAQAGNHGSRRYKHENRWRWDRHDRHVRRVVVRDSGAGPALAGLIGGFILGTAVSRQAPVVVHEREFVSAPRYRYWDPYCDEWFVSLSASREHCWDGRHARVVKVCDGYGGECVRTLRWSDGAWYDCGDEDWRD